MLTVAGLTKRLMAAQNNYYPTIKLEVFRWLSVEQLVFLYVVVVADEIQTLVKCAV